MWQCESDVRQIISFKVHTDRFICLRMLWNDVSLSSESVNGITFDWSSSSWSIAIFRTMIFFSEFNLSLFLFAISMVFKHFLHALITWFDLLLGIERISLIFRCWMRRWKLVWMRAPKTPKNVCMLNVKNVMFCLEIKVFPVINKLGGWPINVVRPAILMFKMMNGNTGTGFRCKHSNNLIVIGVINRIVVTLSRKIEMLALMMQRMQIRRQICPWLSCKLQKLNIISLIFDLECLCHICLIDIKMVLTWNV